MYALRASSDLTHYPGSKPLPGQLQEYNTN